MSDPAPNLLLISIDSLRVDETGFCGGTDATTPSLNDLADDAAVYTNAITPSTWTLPVHCSVFTGLYPLEHQVLDRGRVLGDHPTLAELLSSEGYTTRSFFHNSWLQLGDVTRGFESTETLRESSEATDESDYTTALKNTTKRAAKPLLKRLGLSDIAFDALRILTRPQQDRDAVEDAIRELKPVDEPFAFFLHFNDTHYKYTPTWKAQDRFARASNLSLTWNRIYWQNVIYGNKPRYWANEGDPPQSVRRHIKDLYRACIYQTDLLIGDVINKLEETGVMENTIVVVFGDHGDSFGENGIFGHHFSVDDTVTHVPMLIRDPTEHVEAGIHDDLVQLNDLYPTLLGICGADYPETNSIDLQEKRREHAYTHYELLEQAHVDEQIEDQYRDQIPPRKQYKIVAASGERLVYYPEKDRYEGDRDLREKLDEHLNSLQRMSSGRQEPVSEAVEENLRDMGYI